MTTINKIENSRVEIVATVDWKTLSGYRDRAIADFKKIIKIDGFRPGSAPDTTVEKTVGEMGMLEKMAELAIADTYPKIIMDEKIDAIGRPSVNITKLASDNELSFTVTTDVMPVVTLGDYTKTAKTVFGNPEVVTVTDEELENAIRELRQMRAHQAMHDNGHEHDDHNHQNISDDQLPEFNDAFVKSLSESFENVEDFTKKLRDNMVKEKESGAAEKKRIELMDALVDDTDFAIPAVMVDYEIDRMIQQFTGELAHSGMKFDDYLKMINKTIEELRTEWTPNATKRAKIQLIVDTLSEKLDIKPDTEALNAEVAKMMEMYRDHADIDENRVRAYVNQIMTNTAVLEHLENLGK